MTLNRTVAIASVLAALAATSACKKPAVVTTNESAQSVAEKVAAADIRLDPGQWQSSMRLDHMEVANLPAAAKDAMAKQQGTTHSFASCLTPEQAAKPDASFFQKAATGCTYDHFTMAGGRIDAEMSCKKGAGPSHMTMQGEYGSDHYAMAIQSQSEMQPGMPMKMAMTITARRVGDCTGHEDG